MALNGCHRLPYGFLGSIALQRHPTSIQHARSTLPLYVSCPTFQALGSLPRMVATASRQQRKQGTLTLPCPIKRDPALQLLLVGLMGLRPLTADQLTSAFSTSFSIWVCVNHGGQATRGSRCSTAAVHSQALTVSKCTVGMPNRVYQFYERNTRTRQAT